MKMPWFYYVVATLIRAVLLLFTHCKVNGRENIPAEGAVILVANHLALADPPVLGAAVPRQVRFMAKHELFRPKIVGYIMRGIGAFPVQRGRMNRTALGQADQFLAEGMVMVVFPEGKRSKNNQLQSALPGSMLLAVRNRVPMVPVGMSGTERMKGVTWLFQRPEITINIGKPFFLSSGDGKPSKADLTGLSHLVMRHIAEQLPTTYRGGYMEGLNGIEN
jgi:1-acyl-sn-glycerol-3-phosphate acyltransferase